MWEGGRGGAAGGGLSCPADTAPDGQLIPKDLLVLEFTLPGIFLSVVSYKSFD
jgi:hypothetical protein